MLFKTRTISCLLFGAGNRTFKSVIEQASGRGLSYNLMGPVAPTERA